MEGQWRNRDGRADAELAKRANWLIGPGLVDWRTRTASSASEAREAAAADGPDGANGTAAGWKATDAKAVCDRAQQCCARGGPRGTMQRRWHRLETPKKHQPVKQTLFFF